RRGGTACGGRRGAGAGAGTAPAARRLPGPARTARRGPLARRTPRRLPAPQWRGAQPVGAAGGRWDAAQAAAADAGDATALVARRPLAAAGRSRGAVVRVPAGRRRDARAAGRAGGARGGATR